jgi:hypothetical protein
MLASLVMPPERYIYPPDPTPRVFVVKAERLPALCLNLKLGARLMGCYLPKANIVLIRDDLSPKAKAKVLRHEFAHANGWHH